MTADMNRFEELLENTEHHGTLQLQRLQRLQHCFHSRWIVPVVPKSLLKLQRRWPREVQEVVLVQAMISKNLENSDMNGIGIQDS